MTTAALDHLEKHLGAFTSVWSSRAGSSIRALRFENQPRAGASTYATLGLSEHGFSSASDEIREELVLSALDRFDADGVASFLISLADSIVALSQPFRYGDIIGPSDSIIPESRLNAVYGMTPSRFGADLATIEGSTPPTLLVWALPIAASEAAYIESHGGASFEALLLEKGAALLDSARPPVA